jgi:hypothetical protein
LSVARNLERDKEEISSKCERPKPLFTEQRFSAFTTAALTLS